MKVCQVKVISIDDINAVKMLVGLTIEIQLRWKDRRLTFTNILDEENKVADSQKKHLWLPMREIVHQNAVIGEIRKSAQERVSIRNLTGPLEQDPVRDEVRYYD